MIGGCQYAVCMEQECSQGPLREQTTPNVEEDRVIWQHAVCCVSDKGAGCALKNVKENRVDEYRHKNAENGER